MRPYLALIRTDLKLASRDRSVIFFNYLFPLIFFFVFSGLMDGAGSGGIANVVTMVMSIGILGNGLFGAGMRLVQEREGHILRRFKVTPISPAPILVASIVTGWIIYVPSVVAIFTIAHFGYHMRLPEHWFALSVLITVGVMTFRSIGLIVASVVNSAQESSIVIQLLYMPMLFLSGTTIPITILPTWAQIAGQFMPVSYLITGFQGIFLKNETLLKNRAAIGALLLTMALSTFISMKIFRWEKDERLQPKAKLWVLAVLSPFVLLGCYQAYTREQIDRASALWHELLRSETLLIRGGRIFIGDGRVIEAGAVLIREGRIEQVFDHTRVEPEQFKADLVEGTGKTLLPGLIDVHVHLGSPGGYYSDPAHYSDKDAMDRALAAYLYSGVTAVRSAGDWQAEVFATRDHVRSGRKLGAELFACGPIFTTEGGHGTEYLDALPKAVRDTARAQLVRTPKSADEARAQVSALKKAGADCIKAVLETGREGMLFERMDLAVLSAISAQAHAEGLPLIVHTGSARDVADAAAVKADGVEHGSFRDEIPDATLAALAKAGIFYDPTLSVIYALTATAQQRAELLNGSLLQQVGPAKLIEGTRKKLAEIPAGDAQALDLAFRNLVRAMKAGVPLVTGSDSGNPLVIHGPAIHQELRLWVQAGIPPKVALQAATGNAARALRAKGIGLIAAGREASLLLVDGNPLEDVAATERISQVIFKGERIRRSKLFDQK